MRQVDDNARTWAEIDLSALKHNLDIARNTGKRVMCVIKANAYGHGAIKCGLFLEKNGADAFAVACLSAAIDLREAGITLPILVLGNTPASYADLLAHYRITQTLTDFDYACGLSSEAVRQNIVVESHIKIDTGMSRSGILAQNAAEIASAVKYAEEMCYFPGLNVTCMYTHLCVADTPSEIEFTKAQTDSFLAVREGLRSRGIDNLTCHIGNSAAIMNNNTELCDMVREGIMLYGLYPDSMNRESGDLRPAMTLKSKVVQLKTVPAGATVGYGRTFAAERDTKVAIVAAGYADGYPRRLSNQAYVVINGKRYAQIGRVCMDVIMVDVTDSDVAFGDEVVLFGGSGMSIEEVAQIVGTINYEIASLVTPRATKVYKY